MSTKKAIKKATKVKTKSAIKPLSIEKAFSKSEIVQSIVDVVGLAKKQAIASIDALTCIINSHLSKKGPGQFVFPGIAKFRVVRKPAAKAHKGKNPFTGEPMTFAAKPARNVVKIKPLKKLKDIIK